MTVFVAKGHIKAILSLNNQKWEIELISNSHQNRNYMIKTGYILPFSTFKFKTFEKLVMLFPDPDNKVHVAHMGPPGSCRPQVGPMWAPIDLAIRGTSVSFYNPLLQYSTVAEQLMSPRLRVYAASAVSK